MNGCIKVMFSYSYVSWGICYNSLLIVIDLERLELGVCSRVLQSPRWQMARFECHILILPYRSNN